VIFILILVFIIFCFLYAFHRWKVVRGWCYYLPWLASVVRITVDYWGFNKKYSDASLLASRLVVLSKLSSLEGSSLREIRHEVSLLVRDSHRLFYPTKKWSKEDERIAVAAYVALINNDEIWNLVRALSRSGVDLDVKKATYLVIDVFGELVDRSDKLGRKYLQQVVYGINKSLIIIRDHGTNKKSLKKVTSILFRIYKLSRAYRHRRFLGDMSKEDFYDKVTELFNSLSIFNA